MKLNKTKLQRLIEEALAEEFSPLGTRGPEARSPGEEPLDIGDLEVPQLRMQPKWNDVARGRAVMKRGSLGDGVKKLQSLLLKAGFRVKPDGDFGPGTERAVRKYQKTLGLKVDGIVGTETAGRMLAATGGMQTGQAAWRLQQGDMMRRGDYDFSGVPDSVERPKPGGFQGRGPGPWKNLQEKNISLTKSKLQKLIQEELEDLGGADPQFSLKSDLASAETRASSRESSGDIMLDGLREIEEIAQAAGYEDILEIIQRTSPDHAEGSPDPDNPYD